MNATRSSASLPQQPEEEISTEIESAEAHPVFDRVQWRETLAEAEPATAGGRAVLGIALGILAAAWIAYTAWSAGRALSGQSLTSPAIAQWVAVAAGPLALLGLLWLVFGRTRRKEAEKFTQSVIAMRSEAHSLEALLGVVSQRINDSRSELTMITQHLMQLGDDATGKLGGITREFDASSEKLVRHGEALDRAAESARNDIAVILEDLPRAEEHALAMSQQLREAGSEAVGRAEQYEKQVAALSERTREADQLVGDASQRLVTHLTHIESAGAAAAERVGEAESGFSSAVDSLLERTATTLAEIRAGIDAQSAAVVALVEQASAGLGRAGVDSAEALGSKLDGATSALDSLSLRIAEQDRASQQMIAQVDRALSELDQRFTSLAESGDERARRFADMLGRSREQIQSLDESTGEQSQAIDALAERAYSLRENMLQLSASVREELAGGIYAATGAAERLTESAQVLRPELDWLRDAATEANDRLGASAASIADQQDRLAGLLGQLDDGVGSAETRLAALSDAIVKAQSEAARLSDETGPALVQSMVQVQETAGRAAERAREAIAKVIPESAEGLSDAAREALERVVRESVEDRLREVEEVAARAVESARQASERLTAQMLSIGQSAAALEQHIERQQEVEREKDSEAFARRVALLIDSMNSAAIDVGKILSDEVDEKAWESYLKGNRGIFTRRAVRLLDGSESRAIRAHYDSEREFHQSVNRYVHDFEAMLRRVLAERDGGMIAVTLMSSDMGKLYAALAEALDRRR